MSKGSGHGGAREGSGRKPKFVSDNNSEAIRVPKAYKEEIRKIVELIDFMVAEGFSIEEIRSVLNKITKS